LTDSQDYDFIVDYGTPKRVQIKTTSYKRDNSYRISLTVKGGNQTFSTIKKLDSTKVDYIFILVETGDMYWIPIDFVKGQSAITLYSKYDIYKIG
jgi:hypothetical protein